MIEKKLSCTGGDVYYYMAGDAKECIVFTHGMTMDHEMFIKQLEFFKDHYKVIIWDVPLHGKSRPYKDFSLSKVAMDLNSILDEEGIESVHLVGQSMGGYVIQEYYDQFPQNVKSIIAVDTNPFGKKYYSKFEVFMGNRISKISNMYPYSVLTKAISKSTAYTDSAQNDALETLNKMTKKEIIKLTEVVYKDMFNKIDEVIFDVPTLIIYGEYDKTGFVKKYSKNWAENNDYTLSVISNAGHNSNVDNSDEFNQVVLDYLMNSFQ